MNSEEVPYHHGSHQQLLWAPVEPGRAQGSIDAIIVPTARPPAYLSNAASLAEALQCTLVTLHSKKWTSAEAAAHRVPPKVDLIAVDTPDLRRLRLPRWQTSALLAGTIFERRTDLSTKRNLAIMLSHMLSWSRIVFLDDDITALNPEHFRRASDLLSVYNAVGFHIGGFPDNSVVCHAYRQAGGPQQQFVGGGALAVNLDRCRSFFPDIYNDDWFFLLDGDKWLQPTAVTGQVAQYPYDPYRIERARAEELGDVLAEGLYWLLDQDRSIMDADDEYWAQSLSRRQHFIESVIAMVQADGGLKSAERERRITALKSSLGRLARISSAFCGRYLRAWAADRQEWQRHLEHLPSQLQRGAALAHLSQRGSPRLNYESRAGLGV